MKPLLPIVLYGLLSANGELDAAVQPYETPKAAEQRIPSAIGTLRPVELRCEYLPEPLGIDTPKPRLGWLLDSDQRARSQTAYQVMVASSQALLDQGTGDLWDSGKIASSEQNQIEYAGSRLRANQECFWKVRVCDNEGTWSAWSLPGRWTMGLLGSSDWQAKWILGPWNTNTALPLLRREFALAKPLRRAVVHVCGLGHLDLFLDGHKAGGHFLDPAWSDYEKTVYYSTFDITRGLAPGPHALGVMLGKGFYNTLGDRRVHGVNAQRPLKLILQAHFFYADGTEEVLGSDGHWRTAPGPITHSAILGGEDYDARRLPAHWAEAGFDDSTWTPATECAEPAALRASYSPPLTAHEIFDPVRIDEPEPGLFVYDFGQNASAIPRLRVRGAAGQVVKLVPAEQRYGMSPRRNDGRGLVNQAGVGKPNYFQYTLRGESVEEWQPQFSYSGFQFLQVEDAVPSGAPNPASKPVIERLQSVHVRNNATTLGTFECSEPLFNRIDRIIDWAVRANLSHVLTDCPHREKLGWLEVSYLMGPSIAARYDVSRFYGKISLDCVDAQHSDGLVPTVAPPYPAFAGGFAYTPEWGAAAVVVPWQVYQFYGDQQILAASYGTMKGFVDYLHRTATDLVPAPGLGDWYDYGHGKPVGPSQFTPPELSAMATFHRCAQIVSDTAGVLGKQEESKQYGELARQIAAAFNQRWFNGEDEYNNFGSPQCANSMALVCKIVPRGKETAVLNKVIEDIRRRGNQQTAGDIGHWYLLQALAGAGRHDVIYDMTIRTNIGSYGFIVNNGWTSMPEAWDANTGASMNHCMLGHIQEWFSEHVAGIKPDPSAPGGKRFIIAPEPVGDLTSARGGLSSMRGPVLSEWKRDGTRFELRVTIPPNTSASVKLPATRMESVTESGKPLTRSQGVTLPEQETGRGLVLQVGSGSYRFTVQN